MVELLSRRRLLVGTSAVLYALVFSALLFSERTDLGIGRFFYLAIAVLALATGPLAGAAAGLLAVALYSIAVIQNPQVPTSLLWSSPNGYPLRDLRRARGCSWARSRRATATCSTSSAYLAERDPLTGLGNSRSFGNAIEERFDGGRPFALLIGDMDSLKQINDEFGHAVGDEIAQAARDGALAVARLMRRRLPDRRRRVRGAGRPGHGRRCEPARRPPRGRRSPRPARASASAGRSPRGTGRARSRSTGPRMRACTRTSAPVGTSGGRLTRVPGWAEALKA